MTPFYKSSSTLSNQLNLTSSVQFLHGVGPERAKLLEKLGIRTVEDLLLYWPRGWDDRRQIRRIREARGGDITTIQGKIVQVDFRSTQRGFAIAAIAVQDDSGEMICRWMRRASPRYDVFASLRKQLEVGRQILAHGKIQFDFGGKYLSVDEHEMLPAVAESIHIQRIVPLYSLTEGLRPQLMRQWVFSALAQSHFDDFLPQNLLKEERLLSLDAAIKSYHFPENLEAWSDARARLAFQEIFQQMLIFALIREKNKKEKKRHYEIKKTLLTPFKESLGFRFTVEQSQAIREIFSDMMAPQPMQRILQGDVGSGKTVVALSAILLACENNQQAAFLVPTEILAEQHFLTLQHILKNLPVKIAVLTGKANSKQRKTTLEQLAAGEIHILIGTHAILEEAVQFARLGLVVIDEQHRFGVRHRRELLERANDYPDLLLMTATPIPRTLAMAMYGDLEVSTIRSLPPGRQKIKTLHLNESQAYDAAQKEVESGGQVYIVYPLVDESSKKELKAASVEFERLQAEIFPQYKVGLLHGQLPGAQKEKIFQDFCAGEIQILVATTVIEVGIDVANATLMIIVHAERFGLATLHQLRGRVGRGPRPSSCILVAQNSTPESQARIDCLLATTDGFVLAEKDLQMRGPGAFFGTHQHGLSPFQVANFEKDSALFEKCRKLAQRWIAEDPHLLTPANAALREALRKKYAVIWRWGEVA